MEAYRQIKEGEAVRNARAVHSTAHREAVSQYRTQRREQDQMTRRHRREAQVHRRRWIQTRSRLEDLEARHRSIGDVLAAEAGFESWTF